MVMVFKNQFSGVNVPTETISAWSMTPLKFGTNVPHLTGSMEPQYCSIGYENPFFETLNQEFIVCQKIGTLLNNN
jgi:hypothetical protein